MIHMAIIRGTSYLPVDLPDVDSSEEAVELLAPYLDQDTYITDATTDRGIAQRRVLGDKLSAAARALEAVKAEMVELDAILGSL